MVRCDHADTGRSLQVMVNHEDGKTTAGLNFTSTKQP